MRHFLLSFALLLFAILCSLLTYALPILFYAAIIIGLIGLYQALQGYSKLQDQEDPDERSEDA